MRYLMLCALILPVVAESKEDAAVVATIEKTFRGMAAHDGDMIRSTMLPEARLYAVRDGNAAVTNRGLEEFVEQIAGSKVDLKEQFVGHPQVFRRGRMAEVWGQYQFWRNGKFSHCGVDTAVLFKGADGWRIATMSYTVEPAGCKGQPTK